MQYLKPSPLVASVLPGQIFDPEHNIAFGKIFLEYSMSPLADEIKALSDGIGMPDRADQGWISLAGPGVPEVLHGIFGLDISNIITGKGICGITADAISMPDVNMDIYFGQEVALIGLSRISAASATSWFRSQTNLSGIIVKDETDLVSRIAVMGPDSRKFLQALEVPDDQLLDVGDHIDIEVIQESIHVCRSDFVGPMGFDFIIPNEHFNMILAVFCSWAVRLELNMIPVGWDAIQQIKDLK